MPKLIKSNKSSVEFKEVEVMVNKCLRQLSRKEYGIVTNYTIAKKRAKRVLEVHTQYVRSYAGAGRILICVNRWQFSTGKVMTFEEYPSFNEHPTIGEFKGTNVDCLFALVAHEVSHHVQYAYLPHDRRYKHTYKKPHGDGFKLIYNILRRDLVNPLRKV